MSEKLLQILREYYRNSNVKLISYLFPNTKDRHKPFSKRQTQDFIKKAGLVAGIKKPVSPHVLRQYVESINMGSDNSFPLYYMKLSLNHSPYYLIQHKLFSHSIRLLSSSHFGKLLGNRSEYVDSKAIRFFSMSALAYTSVVAT